MLDLKEVAFLKKGLEKKKSIFLDCSMSVKWKVATNAFCKT